MESAVVEAIKQKLLRKDFPAAVVAEMLMKIYLANLREYLFDKVSLDTYRNTATFEFWFCLANLASDDFRKKYLKKAKDAAALLAISH
jgi:hypothetical protein